MCRWFAYISPDEECLLQDVLIDPTHSLVKQVHDHYLPQLFPHDDGSASAEATKAQLNAQNRLLNIDGFGCAWYTTSFSAFEPTDVSLLPRPVFYKTTQPPMNDQFLHSIARGTASKCVFAHIRYATSTAITTVNNHPFLFFERFSFMHNGSIGQFEKVRRALSNLVVLPSWTQVKGTTDSELIAAIFFTFLSREDIGEGKNDGDIPSDRKITVVMMRQAMYHTVNAIMTVMRAILSPEDWKDAASSLNLAATDGKVLCALRYRNSTTSQPPSLYVSTTAGVTLNRKFPSGSKEETSSSKEQHGKHVIIASEPTTFKDEEWELIPANHFALVDETGNLEIEPIGRLKSTAYDYGVK